MNFADDESREHLPGGLLLRHLDEELTLSEAVTVERHLAGCEECREQLADFRQTVMAVDDFFLSAPLAYSRSEREHLAFALGKREENNSSEKAKQAPGKKRLDGSGRGLLAVAAALAASIAVIAILLNPLARHSETARPTSAMVSTHPFDIDGEKFWPLPYSNPELPLYAPRVVQMQVPVSSLTEAGIVVEPVANRAVAPDRAVLADVLLGLDGQPLGVHVIGED